MPHERMHANVFMAQCPAQEFHEVAHITEQKNPEHFPILSHKMSCLRLYLALASEHRDRACEGGGFPKDLYIRIQFC